VGKEEAMRPFRLVTANLVALTLLGVAVGGCDQGLVTFGEEGSGNLVTETRQVGTFTALDVSGALALDVTVDANADPSVTVTYDDNIVDQVVTRVSGDTLVLEFDGSVNLTGSAPRVIAVTMNELTALNASGATDVEATGIVFNLELDSSGASSVDLQNLVVTDIELDVSGASTVDLHATGTVSGSVSGASNLNIYGEPTSVLVDSSGASTVDIKN
jgi:hypothetical protein